MNDPIVLEELRYLATVLLTETDYAFVDGYGYNMLRYLYWVKPPELRHDLTILANEAIKLRLKGIERTPFNRQLLDESDKFLNQFLEKLPVPLETQP
jgi:hypothetical protein